MATVTVSLEIENIYEDTEAVTTYVYDKVLPAPPSVSDEKAYAAWHEEHIRALTGTGHESGNAGYFVEVTASSDESLLPVGTEFAYGI
jgi:hypothetical protein